MSPQGIPKKCVVSGFEALAILKGPGARGGLARGAVEKAQGRVGALAPKILSFPPGGPEKRVESYLRMSTCMCMYMKMYMYMYMYLRDCLYDGTEHAMAEHVAAESRQLGRL